MSNQPETITMEKEAPASYKLMPEESQNSRGNDFQNVYDLADFTEKSNGGKEIRSVQSLNPDEKYCYLTQTASYSKNDSLLGNTFTKNKNMFHISFAATKHCIKIIVFGHIYTSLVPSCAYQCVCIRLWFLG